MRQVRVPGPPITPFYGFNCESNGVSVVLRGAANSTAIGKSWNTVGCVNWAQGSSQNGAIEGSTKKKGPARGQLVLSSRLDTRGASGLNTKMT